MRIPPSFIFGAWCGLFTWCGIFTWCGLLRGAVLPGRNYERSEASRALGGARTIARTTAQEDRTTVARTAPPLRGPHHSCAAHTTRCADDCDI